MSHLTTRTPLDRHDPGGTVKEAAHGGRISGLDGDDRVLRLALRDELPLMELAGDISQVLGHDPLPSPLHSSGSDSMGRSGVGPSLLVPR